MGGDRGIARVERGVELVLVVVELLDPRLGGGSWVPGRIVGGRGAAVLGDLRWASRNWSRKRLTSGVSSGSPSVSSAKAMTVSPPASPSSPSA
jgi:hypothetical protein